jgi:hypothetical protein
VAVKTLIVRGAAPVPTLQWRKELAIGGGSVDWPMRLSG